METETLDKIYLEWSQFATAKTGRELAFEAQLAEAQDALSGRGRAIRQYMQGQRRV